MAACGICAIQRARSISGKFEAVVSTLRSAITNLHVIGREKLQGYRTIIRRIIADELIAGHIVEVILSFYILNRKMEICGSISVCECMARTISRRKIIRCCCMIKQIVRIATTRSTRLNHIDLVIAQFAHRTNKLSLLKASDGYITICFIYLIRIGNTSYKITQSIIAHRNICESVCCL